MKRQDETPLLNAVREFIKTQPAYFRVPGHRLDRGISPRWTELTGKEIFAYDVTETPLTDDLHNPEGAIRESQKLLAKLYGADKSFFLVNGSTCGNEAMILSAALEGEKIMVARNAHKSAMMGLILSGATPVYVMPSVIDAWGIQGDITPAAVRRCFEHNPDCKALFLVSPSYYGVCSDLAELAQICHSYNALLLVDEAHGGHFYFHEKLPEGALQAGADMCVQSMHKVAGALTQSAVLHIKCHGIQTQAFDRIAENLRLVQSTSPSYLLMTSLDCARCELAMHGREMMEKALALAQQASSRINQIDGFVCMTECTVTDNDRMQINRCLDKTRLVISAQALGITGFALDKLLFETDAVNIELSDDRNVLAIVTYANEQEDIDRLVKACEKIRTNIREGRSGIRDILSEPNVLQQKSKIWNCVLPRQMMTPRCAYFSPKKNIGWKDAVGKVSGQMIAPYPPGIPVIYPGEEISQDVWTYIEGFRRNGRHMHGMTHDAEFVKVIE